jgi:hypothetical protein
MNREINNLQLIEPARTHKLRYFKYETSHAIDPDRTTHLRHTYV